MALLQPQALYETLCHCPAAFLPGRLERFGLRNISDSVMHGDNWFGQLVDLHPHIKSRRRNNPEKPGGKLPPELVGIRLLPEPEETSPEGGGHADFASYYDNV